MALLDDKKQEIEALRRLYASTRSVMIPLLWMVQRKIGYISAEALHEIAELCEVTPTQVEETVSFYTMFHRQPPGKTLLSVCGTLACGLNGSDGVLEFLREKLEIGPGETSPDGRFTIEQVECLGACTEAPAMLVNETLHGNLTREKIDQILDACP